MWILKFLTLSFIFVSTFSFSQSTDYTLIRGAGVSGNTFSHALPTIILSSEYDSFRRNVCVGDVPASPSQYGDPRFLRYYFEESSKSCFYDIWQIQPDGTNVQTIYTRRNVSFATQNASCPVGTVGAYDSNLQIFCTEPPPPPEPLCDSELLCVQRAEEDCISRGMTYAMTFTYTDTNNFSYSCASEPETYEPNNSNCIMSINSHCVAFADEQLEDINEPDADLLSSISNNIDQMIDNLSNFPNLDFSSGGVGFSQFTLPDTDPNSPDPNSPDDDSPINLEKSLTAEELVAVLDNKTNKDLATGNESMQGILSSFDGDASEFGFTGDYVNQDTFNYLPTLSSSCTNPVLKGVVIDICGTANTIKPFMTWGMYLFFLWFLYNEYNNAILWLTRK